MISESPYVRHPAVAGAFYPSDPQEIRAALDRMLANRAPEPAFGLIVPHAGWVYSGKTAGLTLGRTAIPDSVIIICPHHTGRARSDRPASAILSGEFLVPGDSIPIDEALAQAIVERTDLMESDASAHQREHAIEVLLPFLRRLNPNVRIVPIVLKRASYDRLARLGEAMAEAIGAVRPGTLLLASSDMTHFESAEAAQRLDREALDCVERMDPEGLMRVVHEKNISMCGVYPATVMLTAAQRLGATRAELVDYTHSGEVSGDFDSVVAYAGVTVR